MMLARIGDQPTPEQVAAQEKAGRLDTAMSAMKWLAIGGGIGVNVTFTTLSPSCKSIRTPLLNILLWKIRLHNYPVQGP